MAKNKKWEDLVLEAIANKMAPTYLGSAQPQVGMEDQPNFTAYNFSPNRKLDGLEREILTGPEWSIMQQVSTIKALHDLLGRRLGYNFTFEEWFKDWQQGFKWAINRKGSKPLKTNYPYRQVGDTPGWREDKDIKPEYLEWKNPSPKNNPNYRVIEYFPEGEGDSVVFVGSDMMIIQQIINWEWQKSGGTVERNQQEINTPSFRGLPKINLWFQQKIEDKDPNHQLVRGKLGFRIMNKTERYDLVDQGKTLYDKLTIAEIEQMANRIVTNFAQPQPHAWYKGKLTFSYTDRNNGLKTWGYVTSKSEGIELLTKLLAVANISLDRTKLKFTETDDAEGAYPTTPPKIKVLGQTLEGIRKRPYTPVYFSGATLSLESLAFDVALTNNKIVTFDPEKFADELANEN